MDKSKLYISTNNKDSIGITYKNKVLYEIEVVSDFGVSLGLSIYSADAIGILPVSENKIYIK